MLLYIKCKEKVCREQSICLIDFLSPTHCQADGWIHLHSDIQTHSCMTSLSILITNIQFAKTQIFFSVFLCKSEGVLVLTKYKIQFCNYNMLAHLNLVIVCSIWENLWKGLKLYKNMLWVSRGWTPSQSGKKKIIHGLPT